MNTRVCTKTVVHAGLHWLS